MKKKSAGQSNRLSAVFRQIHLRVQVQSGCTLTHSELAHLAGVGSRSVGDWMRGASAPSGMRAILELLSQLQEGDVMAVLQEWRASSTSNSAGGTKMPAGARKSGKLKTVKTGRSQKATSKVISKKSAVNPGRK